MIIMGSRHTILFFAAMALLAVAAALPRSQVAKFAFHTDIEPTGAAVFSSEQDGQRQHVWTVSCTAPLRGCVARTFGAVVRIDEDKRSWLVVAVPPQARLMIRHDRDLLDAATLIRQPLDPDMLRLLSRQDTRILVTGIGAPDLVLQTSGLAEVVDYLTWVQSPLARGLRDARLWPAGGPLDLQNADATVQERFRLMRLRGEQSRSELTSRTQSG